MANPRLTNLLLSLTAFFLLANFVQPFLEPDTAFAQSDKKAETLLVEGAGTATWVLKGNLIYYVKWDSQFKKVHITGPEELDRDDYGDGGPVRLTAAGNSAWVIKNNQVYYIQARIDNNFVTLEIEHPEELPE